VLFNRIVRPTPAPTSPHILRLLSKASTFAGMGVSSGVRKLKEAARIILVGAPGVGKGTQSERLMRRFPQLASISTGDLLRDNVRDKTPLGRFALHQCAGKHTDIRQDCKQNRL
jgi:Adenylate kinase